MAKVLEKWDVSASEKDHAILQRVIRHLENQTVIDRSCRVEVAVRSGVAFLSGEVLMQAEKEMMGEIVRLTEGVRSVRNDLKIIPCGRRNGVR